MGLPRDAEPALPVAPDDDSRGEPTVRDGRVASPDHFPHVNDHRTRVPVARLGSKSMIETRGVVNVRGNE